MSTEFPRCSKHGNERGETKVLRSAREVVTFKALVPFVNSLGFEGKEWKLICILENVIGPVQPEEGLWRAGRGGSRSYGAGSVHTERTVLLQGLGVRNVGTLPAPGSGQVKAASRPCFFKAGALKGKSVTTPCLLL